MPNKMQQKFETTVNKDYVIRGFIMFLFVLDENLILMYIFNKICITFAEKQDSQNRLVAKKDAQSISHTERLDILLLIKL